MKIHETNKKRKKKKRNKKICMRTDSESTNK